jgi:NADH dehydrogenase
MGFGMDSFDIEPWSLGEPNLGTGSVNAGARVAIAEQPAPLYIEREKPVVVTGASGFVGTHVCRILSETGWRIRALVRDPVKAAARLAHLPIELKHGDIRDPRYVRSVMDGAGAVVHLAAIAIEHGSDNYMRTNAEATQIVVEAAETAGVDRFVHMSQNGSDSHSPYAFLRSKGVAQDMVIGSRLRWTVLRPSVIVGPEDAFVNVLARLVRLSPILYPLPGGGTACFQPIFVDDVAHCVRIALDTDETARGIYTLGGPAPLSLRQMAERILLAMHAKRMLVGIPVSALRPLITIAQRILPNPPVTTSLLDLLSVDNTTPNNAITTIFGIAPTPFAPEELLYLRRITMREAITSLFKAH